MATNKLKAINRLLSAIGETSVNSLQSGVPDAEDAERILDEVVEAHVEEGWSFNTFVRAVSADTDGQIVLAETVLRADTTGPSKGIPVSISLSPNGGVRKLYRHDTLTTIWTGADLPLELTVVESFEFDAMPFAHRHYCTEVARRRFQQDLLGSSHLDRFQEDPIRKAWGTLLDFEVQQEDQNLLDNPGVSRLLQRTPDSGRWR